MQENWGLIFDLDGTLVDSFSQIFQTLYKTSSQLNIGNFNREICWMHFGLPLEEIVTANHVSDNNIDIFIVEFRKNLLLEIERDNEVFPGVVELLEFLKSLKVPLGIATSKPQQMAEKVILNSRLSNFSFEITGTGIFPPKPEPAIVLNVMDKMGIQKGFMIGDRLEDVIAGKRAGLSTCAIVQSVHTRKDFEHAKADLIFDSMKELAENSDLLMKVFR